MISIEDSQRARATLAKFLPHVERDDVVIVGGLARKFHLDKAGINYLQTPFNDIDLRIRDASQMKPGIAKDFLIAHYHPPHNSSFFACLIDPQTKVNIDVFDYFHTPVEPQRAGIFGYPLKVTTPEDQLTKTIYDLMKLLKGSAVGPKEFIHANQFCQISDLDKADQIWRMKYDHLYPFPLLDALGRAQEFRSKHPEMVYINPGRINEARDCYECEEVPGYPLTPKEKIVKLLGYVDIPGVKERVTV